ncbi:MAG: topoisomerase, partial [Myxococcales bacterium]|nr:topoisomerase [Myxococcales bacterium]
MPSKKPTAETEGQDKAAAPPKSKVTKPAAAKTPKAAKPSKAAKPAEAAKPAAAAITAKAASATAKGPGPVAKKKTAVTKKSAVAKAKPVENEDGEDGEDGEEEEVAAKPRPRRADHALIIVESPAKAKTIKKYLGAGYTVKASVGHVKDLPKKNMGIDIDNDFAPRYEVIEGKKKVLAEIKKAAGEVGKIFLAPDPDREGEAIAWHIAEEIKETNPNIFRVLFNEITKKAITEAMTRPTSLDMKKFESQQARRILDRLVGYQISPVLWTKVKRGLSAGRVQSVAVRLIVEREGEIAAFKPQEYWSVEVTVEGDAPPPFVAKITRLDGKKAELTNEGHAREVVDVIAGASLKVLTVERKERKKNPPPPFITSKLQQEGSSKLRFSPKRTMSLAQRLYEGVEVGEEGLVGLITYMRTDSTRLSDDAVTEVRAYIGEKFGAAALPAAP